MSSDPRYVLPTVSVDCSHTAYFPAVHKPYSVLAFCAGLLFSCRTIFVLITGRWLNVGTEPGVFAAFAIAAALGLAATLGALGARMQTGSSARTYRPMLWVILYLAFSGCSLIWTASASVISSAFYWLSLVVDVGIVILLTRTAGPERVANSLLKGFIAGSSVLAVVALIMPTAADLRLGDLDYFNTNQIGNLCALSVLMCGLLSARGDAVWRAFPWFLAITLLRSLSKATLVAFIACLIYLFIGNDNIGRGRKWILASAALALSLLFGSLFSAYYDVYTTTGNQAETLTGRTAIWAWTADAAFKRPWLGNGFDAMWKVAPPFGGELFEARHAENELLQQFFAYGLCGVAMLIGIYGSLYRQIRALPRGPERGTLTAFLIYVAIRGLAEAEPFDLLLPLWLVTCFVFLLGNAPRSQSMTHSQAASEADNKTWTPC